MRPRPGTTGAFALLATTVLAGCASLADRIAEPRTQGIAAAALPAAMEKENGIVRAAIVARDGNRIVYRIVPAADYHLHYVFSRRANANAPGETDSFDFRLPGHPDPLPPRGTVIFLHGWGDIHSTVLPWALAFARHGYAGIVPDLRNHGESDRAPAGYGQREARDVVDLIVALRERGQLREPVYLFGVSYGATTAVFAAADPAAKVDGVIAMEPFVNAGKGIREMIAFFAKTRTGVRGALASLVMPGIDDPRAVDAAVAQAGRVLELDLDAVDIGPLLKRGATCTALLSGSHDRILDPADLRVFAGAPRVRYLELAKEHHSSLPMRVDLLGDPLAQWLGQAKACPPLPLPAEPVAKDPVAAGVTR